MKGYVDLQVNGYAGVDFNQDDLSQDDFLKACDAMSQDSVDHFLPTIITDDLSAMISRIGRLVSLTRSNPSVANLLAGIHVEGPYISSVSGYVGAHPVAHTRDASIDEAMRLIEAGEGMVRLVTLAPERDADASVTKRLVDEGILVAAGHSDASLDELKLGIDAGLSLFTHLGNGCPGMMARHDNIITRVLSLSDKLSISLIADGHHIPWHALSTYLKCIPTENVIIVSDAISAAALGPGKYQLAGQTVHVDTDGAAWASNRQHFAGCATSLRKMETLLHEHLGVDASVCRRWMIDNPARLLGL